MYGALSRDVSGLSYSLEIMSYEESVELRATQWNDTDETISYEDLRGYGDPAFVIANAATSSGEKTDGEKVEVTIQARSTVCCCSANPRSGTESGTAT